jgi:uncharacterized membrane protein YdbT with pleckstrin-like domain
MDLLNKDIEKYVGKGEKIIWRNGYAKNCMTIISIFLIVIGMVTILTIVGPIVCIYFYLEFKSKQYILTDKRIIILSGFLNKTMKDTPYNRITDTSIEQNWQERTLNYGDIKFNTAGSPSFSSSAGELSFIDNPFEVKKLIDKYINA